MTHHYLVCVIIYRPGDLTIDLLQFVASYSREKLARSTIIRPHHVTKPVCVGIEDSPPSFIHNKYLVVYLDGIARQLL